jgi:hypothetical protein
MSKLALGLELTTSPSPDENEKPTNLLSVYLIDDQGNKRILRKPDPDLELMIGYVSGFVSVWPMPVLIGFHHPTAGWGYKAGHIDAHEELERLASIPRSRFEKLFGWFSPSAIRLFFSGT